MSANDERRPLLEANGHAGDGDGDHEQKVEFEEEDSHDPRQWSKTAKYLQTLEITMVGFLLPMASSILAPAAKEIASDFGTSKQVIVGAQSGFVCMLGVGPLFLAPMSETFGRRPIFLINLAVFTLLQIPTALAPNVESFLVFRTLSGLFGSVGVANGGGSITDMFETHERAAVLGVYLLGPLLGPSIGPLIGGLVIGNMNWRWIFWIVFVLSVALTTVCYFYLFETRAKVILKERKKQLEKESPKTKYWVEGDSSQSIWSKIAGNSTRAIKILATQPIVLTMSVYQALVFSTMYTLYAQYNAIWSAQPYDFNKVQTGLAYLGPAIGFIVTAFFIVLFIDRLYNWLAVRNGDHGQPEYRLPMANVGAIFLPISLFWFGWTVEKGYYWPIPLAATLFFGASQVSIFNCVQTYYIDAYESNAASALAAGAFLRSMVGGIVPLFVGKMFDKLGYGMGMSVFGIISLVLMPAPTLFYWTGRRLREKYPFKG